MKTKMRQISLSIFTTLLLAASATGQVKSDSSQNKTFSDALETQISCGKKPEPGKAIRALQKAGIIARRPYNVVDSVSFFKAKKSLNVLGLNVYSVSGYDEVPKVFARGAGTSPGIWLGIVVPFPVENIRAKLKNLDSQKIIIEEATDEIGLPGKTHVRTQITCVGW